MAGIEVVGGKEQSLKPKPGRVAEGQKVGFHIPMKKTMGEIRLPSSGFEPSGTHTSGSGHGSTVQVDGIDCPGVINTLMVPGMLAGGSGMTFVGGKGDRLSDSAVGVSKMVLVTTRKDNVLPTPIRSSLKGKASGSDPLCGSDNFVEQDAEVGYSFVGPSIERNVYNGVPVPVNGDLSHVEQNGQNVVEMEAAQKGISVVRNRGNSNSGIMGNHGNNVDRNVDLSPVKS